MPVDRLLPTEEGADLIALVREIAEKELRPRVDQVEAQAATRDAFPREIFRMFGAAGLMSLP